MTTLENRPSYYLTYNPQLPFSYLEGREVRVDLVIGKSRVSENNTRLGTWKESVECLKDVMMDSSSEEHVLTRDLHCSEFLEAGSMTLSFRHGPLDSDFFRSKREEIGKKLHVALDWIKSFKEDTGEAFEANISLGSNGDLSILHAAIYAADKSLVSRLLELGADPTAASAVGTAENLSVNLADRGDDISPTVESIMHKLKAFIASRPPKTIETMTSSKPQKNAPVDEVDIPTDCTKTSSPVRGTKNDDAGTAIGTGSASLSSAKRSRPNRWASVGCNDAPPTGDALPGLPQTSQSKDSIMLPMLSSADWMKGEQQRCVHQKRSCPMGRQCPLAHVNPPLGLILQRHAALSSDHAVMLTNNESFQQGNIHLKTATDVSGTTWYTAAYLDPAANVIYYAEHGTGAKRSEQGIFWYAEEGQAVLAVKRVLLVALQGEADLSPTQQPAAVLPLPPGQVQQLHLHAGYHQMTFPQGDSSMALATAQQHLIPPPLPRPPKPALTQGMMQNTVPMVPPIPAPPPGTVAPSPSDPNSLYFNVYQELLKFADMQAIYVRIFPGNNLKKSCWKSIRKPGGSVSTDFYSPGEHGAVYSSTGWNGTLIGDRYFYPSERDAKYAAFMNFLIQASQRHLVKPDLTATSDGKPLFVKKRLPK